MPHAGSEGRADEKSFLKVCGAVCIARATTSVVLESRFVVLDTLQIRFLMTKVSSAR